MGPCTGPPVRTGREAPPRTFFIGSLRRGFVVGDPTVAPVPGKRAYRTGTEEAGSWISTSTRASGTSPASASPSGTGAVADTVEAAVATADELGYPVVLKAQVKTGGRGKAGGVRVAADPSEAASHAEAILGLVIKGHTVKRLWVETAAGIAHEYYVSFTLDRAAKLHLAMVSARGGIDIEDVAEKDPGAIARLEINPLDGFSAAETRSRSPRPPGSVPWRETESPT